jgi:hypothetical protein
MVCIAVCTRPAEGHCRERTPLRSSAASSGVANAFVLRAAGARMVNPLLLSADELPLVVHCRRLIAAIETLATTREGAPRLGGGTNEDPVSGSRGRLRPGLLARFSHPGEPGCVSCLAHVRLELAREPPRPGHARAPAQVRSQSCALGTQPRSSLTCCSATQRVGITRPLESVTVGPKTEMHITIPSAWWRRARCRSRACSPSSRQAS